ncbi:MAG TPA: hypothetical protein VK211_06280 [Kamptonema sp.]|nr:hypothetical protein [Kamptonema sp.]
MTSRFSHKPGLLNISKKYSQKWAGCLLHKSFRLILTLGLAAIAIYLTITSLNLSEFKAAGIPKAIALLPQPAKFDPESSKTKPTKDANGLLPDGIYLYGQSPQPDQVENEYFVFELRQGKIIGAFYLPRSAFYCFYGILTLTKLDVKVIDSFDGSSSPYSVNLQNYHRILRVSNNDRRILGVCKNTYQRQLGDR